MDNVFKEFKSEQSDEREKVSVRDIIDMPFSIEAIRIKEDMPSKFGPQDTAIVDMDINGTKFVCFTNNKLVFDKFEYLFYNNISVAGILFCFRAKTSRGGNRYYDLEQCEE